MKKTNTEMIRELYTVILGVDNSPEGGLISDIRDIKAEVRITNGNVRTNTAWRKAICWVVGLETGALVTVITVLIIRL